jgi:molecular chaperone HtpG
VDKLIVKEEVKDSKLSFEEKEGLTAIFKSQISSGDNYTVLFEDLSENDNPMIITQSEFMRRMKDMSEMGGGMSFYGDMPDSYNLVVNTNHPLVNRVIQDEEKSIGKKIKEFVTELEPIRAEKTELEKAKEGKKEEEIPQTDKDKIEDLEKSIKEVENKKTDIYKGFGKDNKLVRQLVDLALLSNNMLKGEELNKFIKRSVDLIK